MLESYTNLFTRLQNTWWTHLRHKIWKYQQILSNPKVNGEELANHIYNSQKMIASAQKGTMNANASLEKLELVEKRLNDMEKQLLHTKELHDVNIQKLTSRCDLLCKSTKSSEGYDAFLEEHLNVLIADYVCRSGQIKSAKLFASAQRR